ncbi:hypothetical protein F2Q69_00012724 [Brassica cretica]|uniref:Uncharacterized protein n=1 Tax=Brassica cretica TaxID=69181 RepID=A0A8S9QP46_BRACR|nr:hypothetical protein F2Q69_00012724 [Brassica cretica]
MAGAHHDHRTPRLRQDLCHRSLHVENLAHETTLSCSSPRDEALAADHASIGVRMKPHAPP